LTFWRTIVTLISSSFAFGRRAAALSHRPQLVGHMDDTSRRMDVTGGCQRGAGRAVQPFRSGVAVLLDERERSPGSERGDCYG
jgi:hypothetical protein